MPKAVGSARLKDHGYLSDGNGHVSELQVEEPNFSFVTPMEPASFKFGSSSSTRPAPKRAKSALVADRREVTEVTIQTYVPEFADEFYDSSLPADSDRDRNYIVKAYIYGRYLDENVSLGRGAFHFGRDGDLLLGVGQSEIKGAAASPWRTHI